MMVNKSLWRIVLATVLFVVSASVFLERCSPKKQDTKTLQESNAFVGDKQCQSCHATEHASWQKSHHFMAMLPATDSTVSGNFNNAFYTADGVTSRFFKKDGKFYINTEGEDGKNQDFEVKYTFGFKPLQQYLVALDKGRMQVPRVSWDVKNNKWFHQYANQKIPAHDWLHWTGNAQNWNTMCASCHSTNLQKNYTIDDDTYHTTYSQINVSCESCHGAGKLHIDYINSSGYKKGDTVAGSYVQLAKGSSQLAEINTCAPCHARKSDIAATFSQSDELLDNMIPEIPSTEHYFADGQVNDEDYIYTSFLQSKMFKHGIKCSNCHDVHETKTILTGSATCLRCHAKTYEDPSHTFHAAGTVNLDCKSCHMPGKMYMGVDYRHDHSFRVPRPDLSVKYGTPNACNNCHADKTATWSADAVAKWFGPVRKYHFAEDLIPGSKLDNNSEAHLVKLVADTSVPSIIKATAANYLGSIQTQKSLSTLIGCLANNDAHVRYRALKSLSNFDASLWLNVAGPLLSDKVRAVRIAAAQLFEKIPANQVPAEYYTAYTNANNELTAYLNYQADFSVGNLMIADHYLQKQDYSNAVRFYVRALKKDSLMNYARLNLSSAYNAMGNNAEALKVLQNALAVDNKNDRIYYNLALLSNEMKNTADAAKYFAKAVEMKSVNPKLYYNYGLLLNQQQKPKEAEKVLLQGLSIDPQSPEILYALSFVYVQSGKVEKAREMAMKLKSVDGNNPQYADLFRNLGI